MTTPKGWWRRAAALAKDKRSLCLTRVASYGRRGSPAGGPWSAGLEAAVIRATSHDERSIDYKSASRVFAWARAAPSFLEPLMWALARRAARTRSWAVALKALLVAHGLLLSPSAAGRPLAAGRLPFDLAEFRDRSPDAWGFSAFVRAYFRFLDHRAVLLAGPGGEEEDDGLARVDRLQTLLDLLIQIRPYADNMAVGLVVEAMDCAVIEIFEVYSGICNGIACFLVGILGSERRRADDPEGRRKRGMLGIRIVRRASEQGSQLSSYFDVCRQLGVLNATEFPAVERVSDEDIRDLELLVLGDGTRPDPQPVEASQRGTEKRDNIEGSSSPSPSPAPVTEWVVFDEEAQQGHFGNSNENFQLRFGKNPFLDPSSMEGYYGNNSLIELV